MTQLQEIYASVDGFRTGAGLPTPIVVSDTIVGLIGSVDDLEKYGAFNPLAAGSIERYQSKLNRLDGAVAVGGSPVIRHANWTGGRPIPDEVTYQQDPTETGYDGGGGSAQLLYEYMRMTNVRYNSTQIRVENALVAPGDCLWQALISFVDKSQWGWFFGIATNFLGWQEYGWSSYQHGVVIRFNWNGDVIMLHAGQTDGNENDEAGVGRYTMPIVAGTWEVNTDVSGVRALNESDSSSRRYRNAAFRLESSRRISNRKYGFALESFGHIVDVIQDGEHIARWSWTQGFNPLRDGQERGSSYIIRGNGGEQWTRDGALRTPDTRLYAYSLSTGRNSAVAPGYFV
ncbi:MAG: hypothetical protein OXE95_07965 [Chloroflexi bacterium]|nr:hypothetical protein [Chloroflexota bacterium]